jgi:uncharacterized protein (DUF1015 family)
VGACSLRRRVADVCPLHALHYALDRVGGLAPVVAPPYDVIDAAQRAELAARSPYNVVEIDLPQGDGDRYAHAARLFEAWQRDGVITRDPEPALWALAQGYTGPDGRSYTRRGIFARVRVEDYGPGRIRPHERTHPGPREDRLRLTRATRANLSPIFSLYDDPGGAAWSAIAPHTERPPWGLLTDEDGTEHRLWRVGDADAAAAVGAALRDTELLIADGHHRYETALAYAREGGSPYLMVVLVPTKQEGLTIFPTHRVAAHVNGAHGTPIGEPGDELPGVVLYRDGRYELLEGEGLDVEIVERLAPGGVTYTPQRAEAVATVDRGDADAAFLLRPTRIEDVWDVARRGRTMPQKSTYFYPKLTSGLLFHPLD